MEQQHRREGRRMKKFLVFVLFVSLFGCSNDNPVRSDQQSTTHYIHLTIGDSLGYGGISAQDTVFYTVVESKQEYYGKQYFKVSSFPIRGGLPVNFMMREDGEGNVWVIGYLRNNTSVDSLETILYRTQAQQGSTWNFYYGDTITCTLESRSDTVRTMCGEFSACVRIKIEYAWFEYELHWLAPNIGLVKREFITYSFRPIWMSLLDLKDCRLKG